jgi:hypothetical protein
VTAGAPSAKDILTVATVLAARLGRELPAELLLHDAAWRAGGPQRDIDVADDAGPDLLGRMHEGTFDRRTRQDKGAFYTPPAIAAGVVALAMAEPWPAASRAVSVCDTAVGGGAFLLAAARALVAQGAEPATVVRWQLFGSDVDPVALAVTEASLWLWSAALGQPTVVPSGRLVATDGRLATAATWGRIDGFELVVGNPPFQAQRRINTANPVDVRIELRERFGEAVDAHTDSAALFLLGAAQLLTPNGRSALIVPESMLSARDATGVRATVLECTRLVGFWRAGQQVFDVPVRVCAPVLEALEPAVATVGAAPDRAPDVDLTVGVGFRPAGRAPVPADASSWASLLRADELPSIARIRTKGVLGDLAQATAGYRDQYYGIVDAVVDEVPPGPRHMKLVTSGAIDPCTLRWGKVPVRFANKRWKAPVVDLDVLERTNPAMAAWATARLGHKILLATQTKVLEAVVDSRGWAYPSVPVISITCADDDVWRVMAVLSSPVASVWAHEVAAGGALSANSVRLRASQVLDIPLPANARAWDDGALFIGQAHVMDPMMRRVLLSMAGDEMNRAYGIRGGPAKVLAKWWTDQLGPYR